MVNNLKFRNVAIYSSLKDKKVISIAKQVAEVLSNLGVICLSPVSSKIKGVLTNKVYTDKTIIKRSDLIIAIGGDGTLLSSARNFGCKGIPVLGINLGNLGFLTDIPPADLTFALNLIMHGELIEDKRIFLEAKISGKEDNYIALNEIVLHSGSIAQLIEYDLFIDDEFVYRQKADGLIISTSTGSTAYSMSGNGPILHPNVKAFCLLPMFPLSLNTRPLLVDENSIIKIRILSKKISKISMDSHTHHNLSYGDEILISKANDSFTLIHPKGHDFFNACRTKLGWSLGLDSKE